ncbi:MAG: hypothetical protein ABJF23_05260 [Bryobacteraceae bacterium]
MAQDSPLERAVNFARAKRYAEARQALAAAAEPADAKQRIAFHRLKAAVASGLGEAGPAADEMRAALELAPKDSGLLTATAAAELQAGRLDDALLHVHAAGNTAVAQALTGDIYEKRGDYVNSANAYKAAVSLAPENERYRMALALELVQHQTFEPAVQVLQQASPLFPKSARLRTLLGIAQYAMGHAEEAQVSLADAIAIDPALEPPYVYLARIALEAAGAPQPRTVEVLCRRATPVCHALQLRAGDAAALDKLRRDPPDSAIARCELGRAYEAAANFPQARTEMEACVSLEPLPGNHFRLGRIYQKLGLNELAHQEMERRNESAQRLNEEVSRRESAVQSFRYLTAK